MNIQNTVNNREGLLYAKNQGGDIFNRLNKSTYKKSVGHYENFVVQKLNNMGVQAVREVRTKESIKNNRLIQFVQYTKQPSNRSLKYFIYSNVSSAKNNHSSLRGTVNKQTKRVAHGHSEHQGNISLMMRLPDNIQLIGLVGLAQSGEYCSKQSQPLGMMPRDCRSFLIILLIQADIDSSPSIFMASFIACSNVGSTRKAICLLPLGKFVFDICNTHELMYLCLTVYNTIKAYVKRQNPAVLPTQTGLLTTMLIEVTVMALYKSTQTHPKFTDTYWIIRLDSNIPYGKVSLTRRERRLFHVLFKDDRLVWSGRKPITPQSIIACSASQRQEVAHA